MWTPLTFGIITVLAIVAVGIWVCSWPKSNKVYGICIPKKKDRDYCCSEESIFEECQRTISRISARLDREEIASVDRSGLAIMETEE